MEVQVGGLGVRGVRCGRAVGVDPLVTEVERLGIPSNTGGEHLQGSEKSTRYVCDSFSTLAIYIDI